MNKNVLLLTVFAATCTTLCHAADSPWNGTWKLNRRQEQAHGEPWTH